MSAGVVVIWRPDYPPPRWFIQCNCYLGILVPYRSLTGCFPFFSLDLFVGCMCILTRWQLASHRVSSLREWRQEPLCLLPARLDIHTVVFLIPIAHVYQLYPGWQELDKAMDTRTWESFGVILKADCHHRYKGFTRGLRSFHICGLAILPSLKMLFAGLVNQIVLLKKNKRNNQS